MANSSRRRSPAFLVTIVVLLAACLLLLASLVARLAGSSGSFSAAGGFLLESFSWAGFFVPVYLLAAVVLLRGRSFRRRSVLLLIFSILPFLTLSLLFQVLQRSDSTLPQILVDAFGLVPCALLLFLLLALETIFMLTLPARPTSRSEGRRIAARPLAIPLIEPLEENIRLAPVEVEPEPDPVGAGGGFQTAGGRGRAAGGYGRRGVAPGRGAGGTPCGDRGRVPAGARTGGATGTGTGGGREP